MASFLCRRHEVNQYHTVHGHAHEVSAKYYYLEAVNLMFLQEINGAK